MDRLADILLDNGAMRAINGLDDAGRALLCKQLKIERTDLEAFLRVLRSL